MQNRSLGAVLFHADGQSEANTSFSHSNERTKNPGQDPSNASGTWNQIWKDCHSYIPSPVQAVMAEVFLYPM